MVTANDCDEAELFDLRAVNERIRTGKKARFYYTIPTDYLQQTENEVLDGFIEDDDVNETGGTETETEKEEIVLYENNGLCYDIYEYFN